MLTAAVVPALSLPLRRAVDPDRTPARPMPVPALPAPRIGKAVYGLSALDRYGRVADRPVLSALNWVPGQTITFTAVAGSVLAVPDAHAATRVGADGHLRLPIGVRRACGLTPGERVLLVAEPSAGRLLLHPPATLDALLHVHHVRVLSGAAPR